MRTFIIGFVVGALAVLAVPITANGPAFTMRDRTSLDRLEAQYAEEDRLAAGCLGECIELPAHIYRQGVTYVDRQDRTWDHVGKGGRVVPYWVINPGAPKKRP